MVDALVLNVQSFNKGSASMKDRDCNVGSMAGQFDEGNHVRHCLVA